MSDPLAGSTRLYHDVDSSFFCQQLYEVAHGINRGADTRFFSSALPHRRTRTTRQHQHYTFPR